MTVHSTALQQTLGRPLGSKEIYETKKGDFGFRSPSIFNNKIDGPQAVRISAMFAGFIKSVAPLSSPGVPKTTILSNVKQIKGFLLSKASNPKEKARIKASLKTAKAAINAIGTPPKSKKSGMDFLMRRVTRFALYKLAQGGSLSVFAAGLSLPATLAKDGIAGTASAIFGPEGVLRSGTAAVFGKGGVAHAGASMAAKGVGFTAGAVSTVFSSVLMQELFTFLAITEGPGVVGHAVRSLTPQPIKNAYNYVMPTRVQNVIDWVTHTDKPVANGMDAVGRGMAGVGKYIYDGFAVAFR
ncbi:MAG: hypothetical protein P0S96_07000 [Simkaniaceae bacterium]|nr:hypothetical protein [Candidatus Sacchlamyda saccharinae]